MPQITANPKLFIEFLKTPGDWNCESCEDSNLGKALCKVTDLIMKNTENVKADLLINTTDLKQHMEDVVSTEG